MTTRKTGAALPLLVLAAGLAACGRSEPEPGADPDAATGGDPTTPAADARYLTHLLYAGSDGRALVAAFDQTTEDGALRRAYDAWWRPESGWTRLVRDRDTLPVPRAAWRILPTAGMRVRVGNAGQIIALTFRPGDGDDGGAPLRLEAGEEVALWTGPTGQRESMGLAALGEPGALAPGILFFRRAARGLRFLSPAGTTLAFVLSDADGNGLLILQAAPGEPAVARTWLHGAEAVWSSATLAPVEGSGDPDSDAASPATEWVFDIPETDLRGTIRSIDAASAGAPARAVECSLVSGGETFRFTGLVSEVPPP